MPGLKVFILCLCVRVCIRECPQRPDEGVRFPGVRLKATVSCPVLVLVTKLWKSSPHSSQLSHLFNFRTLTLFYFILFWDWVQHKLLTTQPSIEKWKLKLGKKAHTIASQPLMIAEDLNVLLYAVGNDTCFWAQKWFGDHSDTAERLLRRRDRA